MIESAEVVVARGAKLLDRHAPGWPDRLNLQTIDLAASNRCIIGQVFPTYIEGILALGIEWSSELSRHGFMATHHSHDVLLGCWAREGLKR